MEATTGDVPTRTATVYGSGGESPQSIWLLLPDTVAFYRRFWKQFLLASGSVIAAIWLFIGISIIFIQDLRGVVPVTLFLGLFGVYYAIVLLTIVAGEASEMGSISLRKAYRRSVLGVATGVGALGGMALAMIIVLVVPLLGVVAALYLYLRLSPGFEIAILERLNPLQAVRRAWNLSKGRFWITLLHAVLQHGFLLALVTVLVLLPHAAIAVAVTAAALPAFSILRVLGYLDLVNRQRLDVVPSHYTFA